MSSASSKYERRQFVVDDDETESTRYDKYDAKRDDVPNDEEREEHEQLQIITEVAVPHYNNDILDVVEEDGKFDVEEGRDDEENEEEYPAHNNAYLHRKALLEQVLSEYDQQHQQEKKLYKNRITTLKREKEALKIQSLNDINKLNDTVTSKLDALESLVEEALEKEREERNASYQEIEEHFVMRDNEVEGLLKIIAMQGDELEQAKVERDELRKEVQNMMMTFHTRFERMEEKGFKTNAELTMLREDSCLNKKTFTDEVSKIKQCLCMVQDNVDNERQETHELLASISNKVTSTQKETQIQFHQVVNEQQTIVSSYLQRNNDKFEKINTDIRTICNDLEMVQQAQEKIELRQNETNERMKTNENVMIEYRHAASELNDYVHKTVDVKIEELETGNDEMKIQIQTLNGTMTEVQDNITQLNNKLNNDKLDMEYMDMKFKDAVSSLEQKVQDQEALLTTDIDNLSQNLKTVVECMGTKLNDIRSDIQTYQTKQGEINQDIARQHQELNENLDIKHQEMEQSIQDQMKDIENMYEELSHEVMNVQAKRGVDLETYEKMVNSWNAKFDDITKVIQQRSEAQSLASKEFKTAQNDFEQRIKLTTTHLNTLERRMTSTESTLCNTVTSDLVDIMIQPYVKQNDSICELIKRQADEIKMLKDQIKNTHIDRNAITEKVDTMNKTWEALFQHLAGQLQKEMVDMHKMKRETDGVLKDVKRLSVSFESKLASITKSEETSKQTMNMIKSIQADTESCNTRMTNTIRDMKRQQASLEKILFEKKLEQPLLSKTVEEVQHNPSE